MKSKNSLNPGTRSKACTTLLGLMGFVGLLLFLQNPSAYSWGEQDMMPFYERMTSQGYLDTDFFTNASVQKNPRWIFGSIVLGISLFLDTDWYPVLFFLRLLFFIVFPILSFRLLYLFSRLDINTKEGSGAIAGLICLCWSAFLLYGFSGVLAIGGWGAFTPGFIAANVSMLLGIGAILFKEEKNSKIIWLLMFFCAGLMHPPMALFTITFYGVFSLFHHKFPTGNFLLGITTIVIASVIITIGFGSEVKLETEEFISYYVMERHPWHYQVSSFLYYDERWVWKWGLLNSLIIAPLLVFVRKGHKREAYAAGLFFLAFNLSILAQYVFTEVIPLKPIVLLGPVRFTTLGVFGIIILWGRMLAPIASKWDLGTVPSIGAKNLALSLISFLLIGWIYLDSPSERVPAYKMELLNFVRSSPRDAVFVSFSNPLNTDIRIVANRSVLISKEFPFIESEIPEYYERYVSVFGSKRKGEEDEKFFNSLKPSDFVIISERYRLDYVITPRGSKNFSNFLPVYSDAYFEIYLTDDLKTGA